MTGVKWADVFLPSLRMGVATDDSGRFVIEGIPPGQWTLEVRWPAFEFRSRSRAKQLPNQFCQHEIVVTSHNSRSRPAVTEDYPGPFPTDSSLDEQWEKMLEDSLQAISSDSTRINGTIYDAGTLEPLVNVSIFYIQGLDTVKTSTNEEGSYVFKDVQPGNATLLFTHEGYTDLRLPDEEILPAGYNFHTLKLVPVGLDPDSVREFPTDRGKFMEYIRPGKLGDNWLAKTRESNIRFVPIPDSTGSAGSPDGVHPGMPPQAAKAPGSAQPGLLLDDGSLDAAEKAKKFWAMLQAGQGI